MKVACLGAQFFGGQVDRIEAGFRQLGHEIVFPWEADLIYANDPPHYKQVLADKAAGRIKGKLIFTVLDLPFQNPGFDFAELDGQLAQADAICTISSYTQWQVKSRIGYDSTVIYNPIKPVAFDPAMRVECPYRFASIGRRSDPNKNMPVWVAALQLLGIPHTEVALVGNEGGWGDYLGVQSDANLNHLYNSVDFVLALGTVEGLNLPMIEAMACGVIPVCHKGLTTLDEFLPADLFPEYREVELTPPSVARFIARFRNNVPAKAEMQERLHRHFVANWETKTRGVNVAQAILNVYKTL